MSDKFIFQNARIKSMESKLLTLQTVQRLSECRLSEDAFKILIEAGWGAAGTEVNNFDAVFAYEEEVAVAVLRDFNADGALNPFLLSCDYHNVKAILKSTHGGSENLALMPQGLYPAERLKDAVVSGDLTSLPPEMAEAIRCVERLAFEEKLTPRTIDTIIDKAMYADITANLNKSGKLAKEYFVRKIDYLNILSFLRCRKLGLNEKFFEEGFIGGGELNYDMFASVYESALDALKEKCRYTFYRDIIETAIEKGTIIYEAETDNALLKMWKDENNDMFSIAPIAAYYLTKITELKVVKLIVAGIKNKVAPQLIKERMREIYA